MKGCVRLSFLFYLLSFVYPRKFKQPLLVTPNGTSCQTPISITIYHPLMKERMEDISFESLHLKSGFSGTDTAMFEVLSYLASRGHKITVLGYTRKSYISSGVQFVALDSEISLNETAIFSPIFFLDDNFTQSAINNMNLNTKIWIWFEVFLSNDTILESLRVVSNRHILCSFVSNFVADPYISPKGKYCSESRIIGNGIASYFLLPPNTTSTAVSRDGKWVFHATYQRGGMLLERVFQRVRKESPRTARELHYASYYTLDKGRSRTRGVHFLGSLSKQRVSRLLWGSEYFVYPLVLPWGMVHHDTFATVVLEALAAGVLVVTWDVACLRGVYGDLIELVPVKKMLANDTYDPRGRFGWNKWMLTGDAVDAMAAAVLRLDGDVKEKERRRRAGREWAGNYTWDRIGKEYADWFEGSVCRHSHSLSSLAAKSNNNPSDSSHRLGNRHTLETTTVTRHESSVERSRRSLTKTMTGRGDSLAESVPGRGGGRCRSLRILFYHPIIKERDVDISYEALHFSSGYSGEEAALLEVSKVLSSAGHSVMILGLTKKSFVSSGIQFLQDDTSTNKINLLYNLTLIGDDNNSNNIDDYQIWTNRNGVLVADIMKSVDIFCPMFFLHVPRAQQLLEWINPKRTRIWIWFHVFLSNDTILEHLTKSGRFTICTFVSDFIAVGYQYDRSAGVSSNSRNVTTLCRVSRVIGNGIPSYLLQSPEPYESSIATTTVSRDGKWVFHATYQRGGMLLERVFQRVRKESPRTARELHYASYYTLDKGRSRTRGVHFLGSLSKQRVSRLLWGSEYFVYPLVLPWGMVHHDTFATVVLEALAAGVLVVTWDVACLRGVYGDLIELVPVKKILANDTYDPHGRFGWNKWMLTGDAVDAMAAAVLRLDGDVKEKERRRRAGREWAGNYTWDRIGKEYLTLFSDVFPRSSKNQICHNYNKSNNYLLN